MKASRRDLRVDHGLLWVKNLDHKVTLVQLREFPPACESHQRDVDITAHSPRNTEHTHLTTAPRRKLQTMGHPSACHAFEQIQDTVAVGVLPISPDAVERWYRCARYGADGARRSFGPASGDPDD